jgi:hypothetical protein
MAEDQEQLIELARKAFSQFLEISEWVNNRPKTDEDMEDILDVLYARGLATDDPTSYSVSWNAVKDHRKTREARRERHQQFREEYLSPSDEVRSEAIAEFCQQQKPITKPAFVPEREYTAEELDKMSASEYRQRVLGELRPEDHPDELVITEVPERLSLRLRVLEDRLQGTTYAPDRLRAQLRSLKTLLRNS